MDAAVQQLKTLLELEARHEELLDRLAELDRRVADVLAQYQASRPQESGTPCGGGEETGGLAVLASPRPGASARFPCCKECS